MAFLDPFIVVVALFMLAVAVTTLAFQLYKWWRPEHNDPNCCAWSTTGSGAPAPASCSAAYS